MSPRIDVPLFAVNDVYASIQGEGSLAGTPMVILRLQGCNVGCPWCDTRETWSLTEHEAKPGEIPAILGKTSTFARVSADAIVEYITGNIHRNIKWVLITGGEPAMHILAPLVDALHEAGYRVALETSGTARGSVGARFDWICVSPKINQPLPVLPENLIYANEIKVVIGKMDDIRTLESLLAEWKKAIPYNCVISLQPVSLSKKATEICLKQAMLHGWHLSLQMHRYLDLP